MSPSLAIESKRLSDLIVTDPSMRECVKFEVSLDQNLTFEFEMWMTLLSVDTPPT